MADTITLDVSGLLCCSERRIRISCKLTLGLGFANGYREMSLRGDETST